MPVTTRHLESLIRLAQARARMELREEVGSGGGEYILVKYSFVSLHIYYVLFMICWGIERLHWSWR